MSITPADYLPVAKSMSVGQRTRVQHASVQCSRDKKLLIERTSRGYRAYCFKCLVGSFTPEEEGRVRYSDKPTSELIKPAKVTDIYKTCLGSFSDWPPEARKWVYSVNLDVQDVMALQMVFCPILKRVVVPIGIQGYYQARAVYAGQSPKWLSSSTAPVPHYSFFGGRGDLVSCVVVVEDHISAYLINKFTGSATFALLGTKLSESALLTLLNSGFKNYLVWLDDDPAGMKASHKISNRISCYCDVRAIKAGSPKNMSARGVEEVILRRIEE